MIGSDMVLYGLHYGVEAEDGRDSNPIARTLLTKIRMLLIEGSLYVSKFHQI